MTELKYDGGRLVFTREMKKEYTILMPLILPIHQRLIAQILRGEGYKIELLETTHPAIVNEGLQSVHNDTCYPAILTIGQLIDAVKSGKYDIHKLALIMTQTGGGCRASNYVHLIRKALIKNNLEFIPVISFNLNGMEKNDGFKLNLKIVKRMFCAVVYADMLTLLANQIRPFEMISGETDRFVAYWERKLIEENVTIRVKKTVKKIHDDFSAIKRYNIKKTRVGIVGEIYIKFAPLGNNNLEGLLNALDCEVVIPGLLDFIIYTCDAAVVDYRLFKIKPVKSMISFFIKKMFLRFQNDMINAMKNSNLRSPARFSEIKKLALDYVSEGNKMGEGWLLTGEMLELIHSGVYNIICTQPFGCLPNHIVGKGMIRAIQKNNHEANIVAIDYDPGATKTNQENRIKLMLSREKNANGKLKIANDILPLTTKN